MNIFHLTFVRIPEVGNLDKPIPAAIALGQAMADATPHGPFIRVIAIVLHHQLHITENRFAGVIVWTFFGAN